MANYKKNKDHNKGKDEQPAYLKYGKTRYAGPKKKLKVTHQNVNDGSIRLNKYIANSGICSRREADEMIKVGAVAVNGKIVTELGTKISPNDKVQYGGETIKNERKVYMLLNKPKNFSTRIENTTNNRTILNLIKNACKESIAPIGKMDRNSCGLILLTNDQDMSLKLLSPKNLVKSVYKVVSSQAISVEHFNMIKEGVKLEEGPFVQVDEIAWIKKDSRFEVGIEIHTNKNNIVRKIFEQLGYSLSMLDRVAFAGLSKKNIPRGKYRFLEESEINMLKMLS